MQDASEGPSWAGAHDPRRLAAAAGPAATEGTAAAGRRAPNPGPRPGGGGCDHWEPAPCLGPGPARRGPPVTSPSAAGEPANPTARGAVHVSPAPHGDRPCGSGGPKLGEEPAVLQTQAPTTLGPAAEAQRWDLRQRRWSVGGTRSQVHSGDSGERNPKPALCRCHLLESRGFYGVES